MTKYKRFGNTDCRVFHFRMFGKIGYGSVIGNKENFLKNFSQNFVKIAVCGVVGSERIFKRVWDSSQQAKSVRQAIGADGQIYGKGYPFPMLAVFIKNY